MTETSRRAKAFHRESGKGFCPGLKTDNGARVAKGRFFRCRIRRQRYPSRAERPKGDFFSGVSLSVSRVKG